MTKIIDSIWFTARTPFPGLVMGAVLIARAHDQSEVKGYIGATISHGNLERDAYEISLYGSKIPPEVVKAMFPNTTEGKRITF